jgi:hypothetical protein
MAISAAELASDPVQLDPRLVAEIAERVSDAVVERVVDAIRAEGIIPPGHAATSWLDAKAVPALLGSITAHTFSRTFITLMLEAGVPVPYVPAQVGHEDPTTTLAIYAQVLKRRDRRHHGESFDALMASAVPSAGSIIIESNSDQPDGLAILDMPADPGGFGHTNR